MLLMLQLREWILLEQNPWESCCCAKALFCCKDDANAIENDNTSIERRVNLVCFLLNMGSIVILPSI